jgi:hypothetical protein
VQKSNKEVIDSLVEYFLTQDHKIICKALAGMIIDQNRIHHLEDLNAEDTDRLFERIKLNSERLERFILNGPVGDVTCGSLPDKGES